MSRSVRLYEFGDASVLRIENVEIGAPASGEVRLRIHAIGINRTEITLRSGRSPAKPALPTGLGFEAAGVVETLGPDVTGVSVGDRVALVPSYGAAQYALYGEISLAPARCLVAIPDHVGFAEAAATWAAYGTAWGGLVAVGALRAGQTVLIPAASSSVGLAAIPIANRLGGHPIALTRTSSKANGSAASAPLRSLRPPSGTSLPRSKISPAATAPNWSSIRSAVLNSRLSPRPPPRAARLFSTVRLAPGERYWSDLYIQHSAHIAPGRAGLFNLVRSLPDTLRYENQLIVAEGDRVVAHGRFSGNGRPAAWIAADIVRVEDGKLSEHWDVLQDEATEAQPVSGLPMFGDRFPD